MTRSAQARWLVVLLAHLVAPEMAGAEATNWQLQLAAGSEYDSNVFRLESPDGEPVDIEASPLARLGARLRLRHSPRKAQQANLQIFLGSKIFTNEEAQSENVVISSVNGGYRWGLSQRKATIALRGSHYDASRYEVFGEGRDISGRTFDTSMLESELTLIGRPGHRVMASGGYRHFDYKPDPDFDWQGPTFSAGYRGTLWLGNPDVDPEVANVEIGARYRLDRRDYSGLAFRNQCTPDEPLEPRCSVPTDVGRVDLMHVISAEAVYTGERIYSFRYRAQINDSSSFTESYVRNRFDLGITSELLLGVFVTARATVQFNVFLDSLLITRDVNSQTFVSIDDENRNSLSITMTRDLSPSLAIEGRYVIFSNEFATEELAFRRQTAYLGLVLVTGS